MRPVTRSLILRPVTRSLIIALALGALPLTASAQGALPADSLQRARTWTRLLLAGQADSLLTVVGPVQAGPFSSRANLQRLLDGLIEMGATQRVTEERWIWRNGLRQYWATVETSAASEALVLRWVMLPTGQLGGFGANPASGGPPIDSGGPVIKRP